VQGSQAPTAQTSSSAPASSPQQEEDPDVAADAARAAVELAGLRLGHAGRR
jgi:hypothetical protein